NPSVSDLLIKRFNQMLPTGRANGEQFSQTSTLLDRLADWDGKERLGDLRDLTQKFDKAFGYIETGFTSTSKIDAGIFQKRLDAGDATALDEYAAWISSFPPDLSPNPEVVGTGAPVPLRFYGDVFAIMGRHPDAPSIQKAVQKMFGGKDAPWRVRNQYGVVHLLNSPMLGFALVRGQALLGLGDTKVIGEAKRWPNGNIGTRMFDQDPQRNPPLNPPGIEIRVCDYYASQIAGAEVFQAFELDWPMEKRDAAIAADKALLKQYGDAFGFHASPALGRIAGSRAPFDSEQPWFEKLDHPATAQDVAQGRAIFSLGGNARPWPMPAYPLYANRSASKQDPANATQPQNDGFVWQAEEVMENGKWERYYGFTGRHQIEKVPASEITFPAGAPWTWRPVTEFFDSTIDLPETKALRRAAYSSYVGDTDSPLVVAFKAHNRSGLDQQLPSPLALPANAAKTLPPGIILHLEYSAKINPDVANPPPVQEDFLFGSGGKPPFDYGTWSELPMKKEIAAGDGKAPGPTVPAGCDVTLLQADLRDYFDMSRPGSYRLKAKFQVPGANPPDSKNYQPEGMVFFTILDKTK
ncbi:MAG TPA: hypothetical protein VG733_03145, partial [Chthoniobacteraceae bacterium]|nr:hypothetical protein [Chthoniobacteraceae bacterium]